MSLISVYLFLQFASALSNLPGDETPRASRSRTSSISSVTSDSSFFNNSSYTTHHYQLPSDVESEIDESASNLESYSKDDLYMLLKRFERRAYKYKSKFMEVMIWNYLLRYASLNLVYQNSCLGNQKSLQATSTSLLVNIWPIVFFKRTVFN